VTDRGAIEIEKGLGTNCSKNITLYELAPHYTTAMCWPTIDITGTTTVLQYSPSSFYNPKTSHEEIMKII